MLGLGLGFEEKGVFELLGEGRGKEGQSRKVDKGFKGGLVVEEWCWLGSCCEGLSLSSPGGAMRK